ncbi:MAG: hypothetical protein ACI8S3_001615, partial [Alphaproteobacteria bacterium]
LQADVRLVDVNDLGWTQLITKFKYIRHRATPALIVLITLLTNQE